MKTFKKILKRTGVFLLAIFITVNLFILLSGRFYIYKGIANTYFVGEISPTIYDLDVFPYSTLQTDEMKSVISHDKNYNSYQLSKKDQQFIDEYRTKALLVFKNDTLLFENYWENHTEETVSNSFSVAKTMVSILVGIAIDEGKIASLDDPICKYLPEFCSDEKGKITIRHLLTMSSGLDWTESAKNPLSDNAESYYGENLRTLVTSQEVESEPGKIFKYQSGNSQLLGFIIEKATGNDLSRYAEQKLWKKIGAEHEAYWSLDKEQGDEKAFCCMYATARDYGRLGILLLNKGKFNGNQIIPEWYFTEMMTIANLDSEDGIPNYRYGLHTWIYMDTDAQVNYCRGVKGQYVITVPDENLVIVRIGSSKRPNFAFDGSRLDDDSYIEENKFKIGHSTGLFDYLKLGRNIKRNTGK
mgnify:CR=1 FL=1|tara:strand:- start:6164 stop:7405 length:1242 start_codon:yes stop_codon:yes gene_type:complete